MMRAADIANYDTDYSISSGIPESDFSDFTSEGTLSRCNSLEKLKLSDGYVEENFKIDRRKLEAMILGCPPDPWDTEVMKIPIDEYGRVKSAVDFFDEIMAATNTFIKYPKYLKTEARNKKDPHVRIIGNPDSVTEATRRIQYELKPQHKITMKLDVSWTCHSHIIGKGGNTIQPVVKRTGVSIHFPDGNKNSDIHKSNQVSVTSRGEEVTGLEEARSAVRQLTPLVFTFSLPANAQFISAIDTERLISQVESIYNVQAVLQLVNADTLFGSIKGTEWDATRVKEATMCLLKALCGNLANQMTVQTTIEISPQHHSFVQGRNGEVLRKIMQSTTTKITFPDTSDSIPELPDPLKHSSVIICGGIENVHMAKQNIIGSLPLVLMFDVTGGQHLDQRELNQIMQAFDVYVVARNRRMDGKQPVILKAAERNAWNMYQAWRIITGSGKPIVKANIPASYNVADVSSQSYGVGPCLLSPVVCDQMQFDTLSSGSCGCCTSGICSGVSSLMESPSQTKEDHGHSESFGFPEINNNVLKIPEMECLEQSMQSLSMSNHTNSHLQYSNGDVTIEEIEALTSLIPDRRAPGCEKKQGVVSDYITKKLLAAKVMKKPVLPEPRMPTSSWAGYGLSKSIGPALTQPSALINQLKKEEKDGFDKRWSDWNKNNSGGSSSSFMTDSSGNSSDKLSLGLISENYAPKPKAIDTKALSSYIDSCLLRPLHPKSQQQPCDVNSVLVNLQLEQYTDLFVSQDIDFDTFCTLSDQDLKDLGVIIFGHRQKLLMTIKRLMTLKDLSLKDALNK